jgi:KaiC/GvpD/RAD55 family RecA-like ATPase
MITIKENKMPKLPVCEMICDKKIHSKLDEYDLTKFLNCHSTNLIIGKPQSGKTNLLYQFFKSKHLLKNCYDKIYLFQPSQSRASMKDKLFDKIPDEQKFEELSLENLEYVDETLDEGNNCLIFDDMTAYLKDNEIRKKLKELVMNRRHKHLSIFFLVQTYYSVEKDIRKLFSNIFIFRVSKKEMENIFDEVIETHKSYIPDITKLVFDKPFKYLFVNTDSQRLFSGFDEIIIS